MGAPVTGDARTAEVLADAVAVRIDTTGGPATAGRGPDAISGATISVEMMVAAKMPRRSVCTRSCYHVGCSALAHGLAGRTIGSASARGEDRWVPARPPAGR